MFALFAQVGRNRNNNNNNDLPPEFLGFFVGFICVVFLITLIIKSFYILTLSKAVRQCSPRKRTIEPGILWLYLIPVVALVWHFFMVNRIAESLKREFRSRGLSRHGEDFGQGLGMTVCVLFACSLIPYLGSCLSLVGFVCWIVYWVKIAGYSGRLSRDGDYHGDDEERWDDEEDDEDREEDEDDRPRRRRREHEDEDEDDHPK